MQATINDVAREAGVSKATVSKFLNGAPYVAEETRRRIAAAIERLQFEPNRVAQGLSRRRSHCIGVIVANIGNPFYAELIRGVAEATAAKDYTLLLASTDGEPKKERPIVQAMRQQQVDGIVFASVRMADREVTKLARDGTQVILASRNLKDADVDYVVFDSFRGAGMAVDHLLAHGHKRVAFVGGPLSIVNFQERLAGYHDALHRAGIEPDPRLCISTELLDVDSGYAAGRDLIALADPPTAVFAATDNLAFGVLKACHQAGWPVPERLAIIGFDNVPFGEISLVPLTSVDGHGFVIGQHAARLLIDRIVAADAKPPKPAQRIAMIIEPRLCVRRSCGCTPGNEIELVGSAPTEARPTILDAAEEAAPANGAVIS
jgi:DNA-binding LacI/PurR family transcriptional regulator